MAIYAGKNSSIPNAALQRVAVTLSGSREHGNERWGSIKCGQFLH
jgi:hypothetical protein